MTLSQPNQYEDKELEAAIITFGQIADGGHDRSVAAPQEPTAQEELPQQSPTPTDEFAVNEYMRAIGFKWDDARETWYNPDNVWMYQKAAVNLYSRIEAEATKREQRARTQGWHEGRASVSSASSHFTFKATGGSTAELKSQGEQE